MFTAPYTKSPYITHILFDFKRLIKKKDKLLHRYIYSNAGTWERKLFIKLMAQATYTDPIRLTL
jgi:hypothetical protein